MAWNRDTPEKKLLELIESRKEDKKPEKKDKSITTFLNKYWKVLPGDKRLFLSIKNINRILIITFVGLTVYLVYNVMNSPFNFSRIGELEGKNIEPKEKKEINEIEENPIPSLKELAYYSEKFNKRNLFNIEEEKEKEKPAEKKTILKGKGKEEKEEKESNPSPVMIVKEPTPQEKLYDIIKDFKLVGISMSSNPDVMIEDTKSGKTYFLKKGQVFGDNITIQEITKEGIIVKREGATAKLKLE